jgi:hypothetical protein
MTDKRPHLPDCFGKLETVFPKKEDGLRHTPDTCMACASKTECLRTALKGPAGLAAEEEVADRAYASGLIGFFERWSKKKAIRRNIKEGKES